MLPKSKIISNILIVFHPCPRLHDPWLGQSFFWQELKNKLQADALGAAEPVPAGDGGPHGLQALDSLDDDGFQIMFEKIVHGCVPWPFLKLNTQRPDQG